MRPDLIYCAGGNKKFALIAIQAGFLYGARIPDDKPHFPIYFADQNWKKPNKKKYIEALRLYKPKVATVLDIETKADYVTALDWAEEASNYCERIILIPKIHDIIRKIPTQINGKTIILGYSVPTKYGSTEVGITEFKNRFVHLLGGSPHIQIELYKKMSKYCDIISVDGNYIQKIALRFNKFWTNQEKINGKKRWFHSLKDADGKIYYKDAPYESFQRSCNNIRKAWEKVSFNLEEESNEQA